MGVSVKRRDAKKLLCQVTVSYEVDEVGNECQTFVHLRQGIREKLLNAILPIPREREGNHGDGTFFPVGYKDIAIFILH